MTVSSYDLSREDLERHSAGTMHATLDFLVAEKLLSQENANRIGQNYSPVIIIKRSLLERLAALVFPTPMSGMEQVKIVIVKVV